jgi:hypothetical protein
MSFWPVSKMDKANVRKNGEPERRAKSRFPMEREVSYKTVASGQGIAETGMGRSLNISSGGIWFSTGNRLTNGVLVEVSMDWPVLLNGSCPMQLTMYGTVIRSNGQRVAVSIERYEFRTHGPRSFQPPQFPQAELRPA